jgi:hypothetical protein
MNNIIDLKKPIGEVTIRYGSEMLNGKNNVSGSFLNYFCKALAESGYKLNTLHLVHDSTVNLVKDTPIVSYPDYNKIRLIWSFTISGSNVPCNRLKLSAGNIVEYFSIFEGFDLTFLIGQDIVITWDLTINNI